MLSADTHPEKYETTSESIAIIGMSCRFPGGANCPDDFWHLLESGADAIDEIPDSRWDRRAHYDPEPRAPGKMYTTRGGFLSGPIDRFDPTFFNISPKEAACMDPQQRLLLELSWEALEDAGHDPTALRGSDAGVFIGVSSIDYSTISVHDNIDRVTSYSLTGSCQSALAGRISFVLGLEGPSLAIDTACSSSLVSIDSACNFLRLGKTSLALAGGFNLMLSPDMQICLTKLQALSPDGVSRSFDAAANGYVRSEGGALVVLKRLGEALADGDRILGVIRGSYVNQDGESTGISAPNGRSQEAVIRGALREAGLSGADIDYVEAHGTGTRVGDRTELTAIGTFHRPFRSHDHPVLVGSVKSNIGHLEAASGIAGLLKVVLAMRHEMLPANLHFQTPNPAIPWADLPIKVVSVPTPWPRGNRPRRAGVSSFGFVGTNAHLILEEPPLPKPAKRVPPSCYLLPLSARRHEELRTLAGRYEEFLTRASEDDLLNICHTASVGRAHFDYRAAVTGTDPAALMDGLEEIRLQAERPRCLRDPGVVFLYTGQGCQFPGMGRQLYRSQPVFRDTLNECERIFQESQGESLLEILYQDATPERCHHTRWAQPLIFSIEWALTQLWLSWGVQPAATAGHSIGEYAAACLAGVMSTEDALRLVAIRGRLMGSVPGEGGMIAVNASREMVEEILAEHAPGRVEIAAHNAPESLVVSGFADDLKRVAAAFEQRGLRHKSLQVSHAFHSAQMDPILDEFRAAVQAVRLREPELPLVSNLTAKAALAGQLTDPEYWVRHLRRTVQMSASLAFLAEQQHKLFLEVGPQPVLLSFVRQGIEQPGLVTIPSLRPRVPDEQSMAESVGLLYESGVKVNWSGYHSSNPGRKVALPTYPFGGESLWVEPSGTRIFLGPPLETDDTLSASGKGAQKAAHPLLGQRLETSALPDTTIFEMSIARGEHHFFAEHVILGEETAPGAAMLTWVLLAAQELFPEQPCSLRDITFSQPLLLDEADRVGQVIVNDLSSSRCAFEFLSREWNAPSEAWVSHGRGFIVKEMPASPAQQNPIDLRDFDARCPVRLSGEEFYQRMAELGYVYGSRFRCIQQAARDGSEILCRSRWPQRDQQTRSYTITPGELDTVFQSPGVALMGSSALTPASGEIYVPYYVRRLALLKPMPAGEYFIRTRAVTPQNGGLKSSESDLSVFDEQGQNCLLVEGFISTPVSKQALLREKRLRRLKRLTFEEVWTPQPLPSPIAEQARNWVVIGDSSVARELENRLSQNLAHGRKISRVPEGQALEALLGQVDQSEPWGVVAVLPDQPPGIGLLPTEAVQRQVESRLQSLLELLQLLVRSDLPARLYLVTLAERHVRDEDHTARPRGMGVDGLLASAVLEFPALQPTQVDLSVFPESSELDALASELLADSPETRVALRQDQRLVARLDSWKETKEAGENSLALPKGAYTLDVSGDMRLVPAERQAPGPGQLEIEIVASGLNFKDILRSLGEFADSTNRIGGEAAGLVTRVGAGVEGFQVGDAVMTNDIAGGGFSSHLVVHERYVHLKPEHLTFEEAATVPISFMSAYYGLFELGGLTAGERVLIHAAAGGVGLAAVQLAREVGAEVFATAGSERKREFLRGLGVQHVLDSRSSDFAAEIMQATTGEGVHVVLNSLTGEALKASLRVLTQNGRFIELGKRELLTPEQVRAVHPTASYQAFELTDVVAQDEGGRADLLQTILKRFAVGTLQPLPVRAFPIREAPRAFDFMTRALHLGRIALSHRQVLRERELSGELPLRSDGCYLITGGLGGLGLELAAQMASHPVGTLVLIGRSAPSGEALERLEQLKAAGTQVLVKAVDVSQAEQVEKLFLELQALPHRLRGIVHAAGVLEDGSLTGLSWDRFARPLAPKVQGAWNLHRGSREGALDFFVLFSSVAATVGNRGQGNYAAANAFLNSLCLYRRGMGLPATSICWGPWASVGMAAADARRGERMAENGILGLESKEALTAMFDIIRRDLASPTVMDIDWSRFLEGQPPELVDTYLQHLSSLSKPTRTTPKDLPEAESQGAMVSAETDLLALPAEERAGKLLRVVVAVAARVMGHKDLSAVPTDVSLTRMGLDSLMSMDFRAQLEKRSLSVPFAFLAEEPSLERIASFLAEELVPVA